MPASAFDSPNPFSARRLPWLWIVLALPALAMAVGFARGTDAADLLHPSGEMSARLMIVAMMIGPLAHLVGRHRPAMRWLLARRRAFGVAAALYALLHLLFYVRDMETLSAMWEEIGAPGIWTGWVALALMLPLLVTSNNRSMRMLRAGWKTLQRLVYPLALFTVIHWGLLFYEWGPALAHIAPLVLLHIAATIRLTLRRRERTLA